MLGVAFDIRVDIGAGGDHAKPLGAGQGETGLHQFSGDGAPSQFQGHVGMGENDTLELPMVFDDGVPAINLGFETINGRVVADLD